MIANDVKDRQWRDLAPFRWPLHLFLGDSPALTLYLDRQPRYLSLVLLQQPVDHVVLRLLRALEFPSCLAYIVLLLYFRSGLLSKLSSSGGAPCWETRVGIGDC